MIELKELIAYAYGVNKLEEKKISKLILLKKLIESRKTNTLKWLFSLITLIKANLIIKLKKIKIRKENTFINKIIFTIEFGLCK